MIGRRGPSARWRSARRTPCLRHPRRRCFGALSAARAVIVGPSNPVISIWPILHVLGDTLRGVSAPVVYVSPVVGGAVVKGPTAAFLTAYGEPVSAGGVAAFYERIAPGLLNGALADEDVATLPTLRTNMAMTDVDGCVRLAEQTLEFALELAR